MSIRSTALSTILARMGRYTTAAQVDETYQVRDLDEGIRAIRRFALFPWTLQKGSLRVFDGVKEYPVATDHDELAYLDVSKNVYYPSRARFKYTSLKQFYEDPTNRNEIAEIWDGNERFLGVNYKNIKVESQTTDNAETVGNYTASGDASAAALDEVIFKEGNGSIRFTVTYSGGTATIKCTFASALSDSEYQKKYYFRWIYLDVVPTSIELRLQTNDSNYLSKSVTTQFSGQAFKADQWNLVAMDLDLATETGTFNSASIASDKVILTLTASGSGTYYLDAGFIRPWELMDYWYYSIYQIIASGGTTASKEFFFNDSATPQYNTGDALVADPEWVDCVMFDAILTEMIDMKDKDMRDEIKVKRNDAWSRLLDKYPSLEPVIITDRYRFIDDFVSPPGTSASSNVNYE